MQTRLNFKARTKKETHNLEVFISSSFAYCYVTAVGSFFVALMSSCSPAQFEALPLAERPSSPGQLEAPSLVLQQKWNFETSVQNFEQIDADENKISASFQVRDSLGQFVNNLRASDFILKQNNQVVPNFEFEQNVSEIVQTVDIAFLIDVTGSMQPTIDNAKQHVIDFINTSRAKGYRTRMCFSTFGDYTVSQCSRFYDNNPKDVNTLIQVNELISEIAKLRALKDPDPGGWDFNENPMRALIDASRAPWGSDSLRFVVLITDDGFLFSPGNSGAVGSNAPRYNDVLTGIQSAQLKVFAVTPTLAGYNRPFNSSPGRPQPSIVDFSGGQHFEFRDVVENRITFTSILNRILSQVQSTYRLSYVADDDNGLKPELPLQARQIRIELPFITGAQVEMGQISSSQPTGRPEFLKKFRLSDKKIKSGSLRVFINEQLWPSGFQTSEGYLFFAVAPPKKSKIRVEYELEKLEDSIRLRPIFLESLFRPESLRVFLNQIEASSQHLIFNPLPDGRNSLQFAPAVLSENDPYMVRKNRGLNIEITEVTK